jgi:sulfatase modifying factor 1
MKKSIFIICSIILSASYLHAQADPTMVAVKGGSFDMGDRKGGGDPDEKPLHTVTVSDFEISKTEITVRQWREYVNANQLKMPDPPAWGWIDDHPVVNVTWEEASAYCKWLSTKTGKAFRLPTEAEWEYAARGGAKGRGFIYSGSDNINDVGWVRDNAGGKTHPVAQKKPNELGLYDMSGNAWEWCSDFLDEYSAAAVNNPTGAAEGTFRIRRGGSWDDLSRRSRISYRMGNSPRRSYHSLGFRVVSPK